MPYTEFHCVHLLYSSVQFENIFGEAGTKGVGSKARADRKAVGLHFYSIEFFGMAYM